MSKSNQNPPDPSNNQPPREAEIEALLTSLRPTPRPEFHQRMARQPWNQSQVPLKWQLRLWDRSQFVPVGIALILILVILVGLVTPNLDVLANRIAQYFTAYIPDQVSVEIPVVGLDTHDSRFSLSVAEAAKMAGYALKEPRFLPPEYTFQGAYVNEARGAVTLAYHTESGMILWITQRSAGVEYQRISIQATIEQVQIAGLEGEYVEGGWTTSQPSESGPTPALTVTLQAVWDPQANIHFLRWQENDILYELFFSGADPTLQGYLGKSEMIVIAEGLR